MESVVRSLLLACPHLLVQTRLVAHFPSGFLGRNAPYLSVCQTRNLVPLGMDTVPTGVLSVRLIHTSCGAGTRGKTEFHRYGSQTSFMGWALDGCCQKTICRCIRTCVRHVTVDQIHVYSTPSCLLLSHLVPSILFPSAGGDGISP